MRVEAGSNSGKKSGDACMAGYRYSTEPGQRGIGRDVASAQRGLTLIELLVTLSVLAILLGIAVPSFTGLINSNRLTSRANELVAAFGEARIEAIRRNQHVVICRSANANAPAPTCATGGAWPGWISFTDVNGNAVQDPGERVLRTSSLVAPVTIIASPGVSNSRISVWSDGMARTDARQLVNITLRVCQDTTLPTQNARDVALGSGSRTSITSIANDPCTRPSDAS